MNLVKIFTLTVILASCSSTNEFREIAQQKNETRAKNKKYLPLNVSISELVDGKWDSGCGRDFDSEIPEQTVVELKGNLLTSEYSQFSDKDCSNKISSKKTVERIQLFKLGAQEPGDGYGLSSTIEELYIKPVNFQMVQEYNKVKKCGFSDWRIDVYKSVIATSCSSFKAGDAYRNRQDDYMDFFWFGDQLKLSIGCSDQECGETFIKI